MAYPGWKNTHHQFCKCVKLINLFISFIRQHYTKQNCEFRPIVRFLESKKSIKKSNDSDQTRIAVQLVGGIINFRI